MTIRNEERFAFAVMEGALGVPVIPFDDGTKDGMVDGLFEPPDGQLGAVEVTTVGDQRSLQIEAILDTAPTTWPGLSWTWHVHVDGGVRMKEFQRRLLPLLVECERQGAVDPAELVPVDGLFDDFRWYIESDISAYGFAGEAAGGRVFLVPGLGQGGAVPDSLAGFSAWLGAELSRSRFDGERAKLAATGRHHQHLFLRVHESWMPFEFQYLVVFGAGVPSKPPLLPGSLTSVWLGTRWQNPLLWWDAERGWNRFELAVTGGHR